MIAVPCRSDAMDASSPPSLRTSPPRASALLEELVEAFPNEQITVRELLDRLDGRAFGLLLLLLALPMCIPNIPGISTVFGVAMIAPALQMILGKGRLWLPDNVRAWSFSRDALKKGVRAALPILKRIEKMARPRWTGLLAPHFRVFWGLQALVMALVLILPIPGGNWPVGVAVAALALALLQQDGLLAFVSFLMSLATLAVVYLIIRYGPRLLIEVGQALDSVVSRIF